MKTIHRNEGFLCAVCGQDVPPAKKSCRDHCITCLSSLHVDAIPGDRASACKGILAPLRVVVHAKKGYMIQYRCQVCGYEHQNRAADDDSIERLAELVLAGNRHTAGF